MLVAAAPLVARMGEFIPALISALIHLAIAGMPVLSKLLEWLTAFSYWLGPAIDDAAAFARSPAFNSALADVWHVLATIGEYLWRVIKAVVVIAVELARQLFGIREGGIPLIAMFEGIASALEFVGEHMDVFGPLIITLGILYVAFQVLTAAMVVFNVVATANPVVLAIVAFLALAAILFVLYHRFQIVRDVVDAYWKLFKMSPIGWLVRYYIWLGKTLWKHKGLVVAVGNAFVSAWNWVKTAVNDAIAFVKPKFEWLIDKLKWLRDNAGKILDAAVPGGEHGLASRHSSPSSPGLTNWNWSGISGTRSVPSAFGDEIRTTGGGPMFAPLKSPRPAIRSSSRMLALDVLALVALLACRPGAVHASKLDLDLERERVVAGEAGQANTLGPVDDVELGVAGRPPSAARRRRSALEAPLLRQLAGTPKSRLRSSGAAPSTSSSRRRSNRPGAVCGGAATRAAVA